MSIITASVINKYNSTPLTQRQYTNLQNPQSSLSSEQFTDAYINEIPKGALAIVGYFYQISCNHPIILPSQETIASKIGISPRQVRRHITFLKDSGFIASHQRWNNSLLYKIHPIFSHVRVRLALSKVCRSFKFLPLWMLALNGEIRGDVRLGISNSYINIPLEHVSHMVSFNKDEGGRCPTEISHVLRSLKFTQLTKWGQIRLACYPDAALLYAEQQFRTTKGTIKAPFEWFKSVCERYCREKGLRVDRSKSESLSIKFPEPQGARYFIPPQKPVSDNTPKYYTPPPKKVEDPSTFKEVLSKIAQDPRTSWLFTPDAQSCAPRGQCVRSNAERAAAPPSSHISPDIPAMDRCLSLVQSWITNQDDPG